MVSQLAGADHVVAGAEVRAGMRLSCTSARPTGTRPSSLSQPASTSRERKTATSHSGSGLTSGLGPRWPAGRWPSSSEELAPDLDRLVFAEPAPKWDGGT